MALQSSSALFLSVTRTQNSIYNRFTKVIGKENQIACTHDALRRAVVLYWPVISFSLSCFVRLIYSWLPEVLSCDILKELSYNDVTL
jgi:hypothetical protein